MSDSYYSSIVEQAQAIEALKQVGLYQAAEQLVEDLHDYCLAADVEDDDEVLEEEVFPAFPKMPRWSRNIVITEKIDGTNGVIQIADGDIRAGSRNRWLESGEDNFSFAKWVHEHRIELVAGLGEGTHHGEWWGKGIQRGYGLDERRFSLFNVSRWIKDESERRFGDAQKIVPACCHVVPVLYYGDNDSSAIAIALNQLRGSGSVAAPNFTNPEGVCIFHEASRNYFKKTIDGDDTPKSAANDEAPNVAVS
jgi:hypothetical protein